ncbi:MAG: hypothetical protein AAGI01_05435, partial [Myxococcota bacterium]
VVQRSLKQEPLEVTPRIPVVHGGEKSTGYGITMKLSHGIRFRWTLEAIFAFIAGVTASRRL